MKVETLLRAMKLYSLSLMLDHQEQQFEIWRQQKAARAAKRQHKTQKTEKSASPHE